MVNQSITATITQLADNVPLHGKAKIDVKNDVMPSDNQNLNQMKLFSESVQHHVNSVNNLKNLRKTKTSSHPLFGEFTAHKWNCMFAFHLSLHIPQAKYVLNHERD